VVPNDDPTSKLSCNSFFVRKNIPATFMISTVILQKLQALSGTPVSTRTYLFQMSADLA
jgi:hypothetical protein